jgi:hypothetical protein
MALLLAAFLAAQEAPVKLKFDVQHMPSDPGGKPRPLEPQEIRAFEAELKALPGVRDAACTPVAVTLTLQPEARLKLSEIRMAGKRTLGTETGKPVLVFNSITLEGRVSVTLRVEKNRDQVKDALKGYGEVVSESDETYELKLKSGVPVLALVKAVAAKTGVEYKVFEILKDVVWHGTK